MKLKTSFFFQIYIYIVSIITLAVAVGSLASTLRASASYIDTPFAYTLYEAQYPISFEEREDITPIEFKEEQRFCQDNEDYIEIDNRLYCFNQKRVNVEIITGLIITLIMTTLFIIHQRALSNIKKRTQWLENTYTLLSLVGYSIVSIIALVTSISLTSNYIVYTHGDWSTKDAPALIIATALITIPIWISFIIKTTRLLKKD